MAKINWSEPALQQLESVAEYIAIDNFRAAKALVQDIFDKTHRLEQFPQSGRMIPELPDSIYREVVVPPVRIFYRTEGDDIFILHVMRVEQQLRQFMLSNRSKQSD